MTLFATQSREQLRAAYREAWRRANERLPLEPLQAQIADVVALHPEYHADLEAGVLGRDPPADAASPSPFLHMGLHLALREQLATDRPAGIAAEYRRLAATTAEPHAAEHRMIEVLATVLWEAQRAGRAPDQQHYMEQLRRL